MKKILLLLFVSSLFSCTTITKDGKECFNTQSFEVLQGLEGGALAYECPWYDNDCDSNPLVHLTSPKDIDYYDEQKITSTSTTCWIQDGVYRYTTKNERKKTVPNLILIEK